MAENVAAILADFHKKAATNEEITCLGGIEAVIKNTSENFEQTEKYINVTIPKEVYREVKNRTNHFLKMRKKIFYQRIATDRIRDCHGDLHLELLGVVGAFHLNRLVNRRDVIAGLRPFLQQALDILIPIADDRP
jgi:aminoglycoside phosphotransferase family enzyme